jgi:hypothetical protein
MEASSFAGSRLSRLNFTECIRGYRGASKSNAISNYVPRRSGFLDRYVSGVTRSESISDIFVSQFLSVLIPVSVLGQSLLLPSFRAPNFGLFGRKPDPPPLRFFLQCAYGGSVMSFSCDGCHRIYSSTHFLNENPLWRLGGTSIAQNTPHPFLKHCSLRQGLKP